jgi:hypothetical protein
VAATEPNMSDLPGARARMNRLKQAHIIPIRSLTSSIKLKADSACGLGALSPDASSSSTEIRTRNEANMFDQFSAACACTARAEIDFVFESLSQPARRQRAPIAKARARLGRDPEVKFALVVSIGRSYRTAASRAILYPVQRLRQIVSLRRLHAP